MCSVYMVAYCGLLVFFFFKQKAAYELRFSNWSSDVCSSVLSATIAQLEIWGWRIPFVIGAGCAIVAMVLRRNMAETESFQRHRAPRDTSLLRELAKHPKALATVVGLTMGGTLAFYRSEEHTSELQSLMRISYAVFCLKKTKI